MSEIMLTVRTTRFPAVGSGTLLDVREVRAYVRKALAEDANDIDLDDVEAMTAEIATNAAKYTLSGRPAGGLRVTVLRSHDRVRLEFEDDGGAETVPAIPDRVSESGRGLMIVRALSDAWGRRQRDTKTTVWFELLRRP